MPLQIPDGINEVTSSLLVFLPKLLAALVVFLIGLYIASLLSRWLQRALERRRRDPEITLLLTQITRWGTVIFFTIVALQQVDFNLTAFAAGLGILGFTVGFALQDVSKNFIAGLLLLLQQPFELGDLIEVDGYTGRVMMVNLRATELNTLDGRLVQIPNGDVFTSPIINMNRNPYRRIEIRLGVAMDSDLELVRRTVMTAVARVPGLLPEPAAALYYQEIGSSSIDFVLFYWVNTVEVDILTAKDAGLTAINNAFAREGIELPYPTQTIQLQRD